MGQTLVANTREKASDWTSKTAKNVPDTTPSTTASVETTAATDGKSTTDKTQEALSSSSATTTNPTSRDTPDVVNNENITSRASDPVSSSPATTTNTKSRNTPDVISSENAANRASDSVSSSPTNPKNAVEQPLTNDSTSNEANTNEGGSSPYNNGVYSSEETSQENTEAKSARVDNTTAVIDATDSQTEDATLAQTPAQFLAWLKPLAIQGWSKYKVLPSLTGAQGYLESTYGNSDVATSDNNLFGVTLENGNFKHYVSREASVEDHGRILSSMSRYANIIGNKNSNEVTAYIQTDGWAESSEYTSRLRKVINEYHLTEWDQEAFASNDYNVIEINYTPGYGILALDSTGSQISGTNTKFVDGTRWKAFDINEVGGQIAYRVSNTEYIPIGYTQFSKAITINYEPGYGVDAVDVSNKQIAGSNSKFLTGTSWNWSGWRVENGEVQFKLSNTEWINSNYTIGGGYIPNNA